MSPEHLCPGGKRRMLHLRDSRPSSRPQPPCDAVVIVARSQPRSTHLLLAKGWATWASAVGSLSIVVDQERRRAWTRFIESQEMSFLSTTDQDKLRARFEQELERDVRIVLFAEPPTGLYIPGQVQSQTGRVATQLMEEVAGLSPKLRLEVHNPRIERESAQA